MAESNELEAFDGFGSDLASDPASLDRLNQTIDDAVRLEEAAAMMEEDLKAIRRQLNLIKSQQIPDMMAELGVEKLTRNGAEVSVSEFVSGSLPKDEEARARAIRWLEEHDGAGLIKTEIVVSFGRGEKEEADELANRLSNYSPVVETGVHAATLQSYARERIRSGEEIDTETLGLYTGRVAKIKVPKK